MTWRDRLSEPAHPIWDIVRGLVLSGIILLIMLLFFKTAYHNDMAPADFGLMLATVAGIVSGIFGVRAIKSSIVKSLTDDKPTT